MERPTVRSGILAFEHHPLSPILLVLVFAWQNSLVYEGYSILGGLKHFSQKKHLTQLLEYSLNMKEIVVQHIKIQQWNRSRSHQNNLRGIESEVGLFLSFKAYQMMYCNTEGYTTFPFW